MSESMTLTQHLLGTAPYVLIELREASDGTGEPAIFVETGGGAEDEPVMLPLLVVTEAEPGDDNPLAVMLRGLASEYGSADHREVLAAIVEQINPDWSDYVMGSV